MHGAPEPRLLSTEEQTIARPELPGPAVFDAGGDASTEALVSWCEDHAPALLGHLASHGAILFRGFDVRNPEGFRRVLDGLGLAPPPFAYAGNTLRRLTGPGVAEVSYAPPWTAIFPHNEMFYWPRQPRTIAFFCERAEAAFGETPLVDCRRVYRQLPAPVREVFDRTRFYTTSRFASEGSGARNPLSMGTQLKNTWQAVAATRDRGAFEAFVDAGRNRVTWHRNGSVSVRVENPMVLVHPDTGERCVRTPGVDPLMLTARFNEALLQRLAGPQRWFCRALGVLLRTGSRVQRRVGLVGGELDRGRIREVVELMWDSATFFRWRAGDVLVVDNLSTGHGRMNVDGPRTLHVALGGGVEVEPLALPSARRTGSYG